MYGGIFDIFVGLLMIVGSFLVKSKKSEEASFIRRYNKQFLIVCGVAMVSFGTKIFIKEGRIQQSKKASIKQQAMFQISEIVSDESHWIEIPDFTNESTIIKYRNENIDLNLTREDAINIAKIIFVKQYQPRNPNKDYEDLIAVETRETWIVRGILKQKKGKIVLGGIPEIEIRKKDGCVLHLTHSK